ncbi:MAG TPA: hypothetical protein ENI85_01580 [Deltaproteobacteria bacterium]|nr:hypothetical protein [Deltaproteobacteria bacterium]
MTESRETVLERAILTLLRPLVRLVLKRGMAHGQFAELVKRAYVETARSDFSVPGRKLTVSRVAVLTGLTRKEASRLMQPDDGSESEGRIRRRANRAARVVSAWVEDENYHDGRGSPASLPFDSEEGPSFSSLVAEHGADVTPRAVLDELVRVGAVRELKDGRYRLVERAYIPLADEAAKLEILGTDVSDLIASIEHNLELEAERPFFQRKVAYDNLPASYLPELRALLADKGQKLLEELNKEMARHDRDVRKNRKRGANEEAEDETDEQDRHRAMIGIYYFEDSDDESE